MLILDLQEHMLLEFLGFSFMPKVLLDGKSQFSKRVKDMDKRFLSFEISLFSLLMDSKKVWKDTQVFMFYYA